MCESCDGRFLRLGISDGYVKNIKQNPNEIKNSQKPKKIYHFLLVYMRHEHGSMIFFFYASFDFIHSALASYVTRFWDVSMNLYEWSIGAFNFCDVTLTFM